MSIAAMNRIVTKVRPLLESVATIHPKDHGKYCRTGPGEYAEGDKFLGVTVPNVRKIARQVGEELTDNDAFALLQSPYNEERLAALFILISKYDRGNSDVRRQIYDQYLQNTKFINNWNLVDSSAYHIVGKHLEKQDRTILDSLVVSDLLWDRRIAIVSTYWFIRKKDLDWTFRLAKTSLDSQNPEHDLMQKAIGWMLREAGKRDESRLTGFLLDEGPRMPRVMLRYSIEKYPSALQKKFLALSKQT